MVSFDKLSKIAGNKSKGVIFIPNVRHSQNKYLKMSGHNYLF